MYVGRLALTMALLFGAGDALAQDTTTNSVGMRLRKIAAGMYHRGDDHYRRGFERHFNSNSKYSALYDETPRHPVRLTKPYYLAEAEVTVGQFKQFVAATKYQTTAESTGRGIDGYQPKPGPDQPWRKPLFQQQPAFTWRNPGFNQTDDHPVVGVSWADAQAYCRWLSEKESVAYRLPTEAEWEYACRAGTQTWFAWGDEFAGVIHTRANIADVELGKVHPEALQRQWLADPKKDTGDGHAFTSPVKTFPANPWGLFDMHGNVWEWCEDFYDDKAYKPFDRPQYYQAPKLAVDPLCTKPWNDAGKWHVIRGGSWCNGPVQCRSTVRSYYEGDEGGAYLGFRVVREAPMEDVNAARKAFEREDAARQKIAAATGGFQNDEDNPDGVRVTIRPEMNISPLLREVPEITDVIVQQGGRLTGALIADLAEIPNLRGLVIWNLAGVTAKDFDVLAGKTTLRRFELHGVSPLTDALLEPIAGLTELRRLRLEVPGISEAAYARLGRLKKLEMFVNTQSSGPGATGEVLAALAGAPLKTLGIRGLRDEHAKHLRSFPDLRELTVRGAPLTAEGFAHVEALTRLERLDVSQCAGIADTGFAPLAKLEQLRFFAAEGSGAGDGACRRLGGLQKLVDLRLGSAALTDAGVEHLGQIVSLRNLGIESAARLTDQSLRHLWRLDRLEMLHIDVPGPTGAGLDELADLKKLREIRLVSFTDAGLRQAALLPHLEQLTIASGPAGAHQVTDKGLIALADAAKLRGVQVQRKGSQITDAGIGQLKERAPRLAIQANP